ncbi:MAG: glutaredoxin family protein [Gammaproteobacteria bacterium]|jgi:hypothetical protein|nr:glutaredoxin family protein [Gammaproteobacteria bacterium]MBT6044296.1 glutaredoxin family protein [Gammaproteobacteria bacterium]
MTAINNTEDITSRTLILYSTSACHLCETALALIAPQLDSLVITLEEVDISESDALMARYGIRIPVLKFAAGKEELGWPFSEEQFLEFARL